MKRTPLPFVGNKGRYENFQKFVENIPEEITDVYDLFGGSFFCGYYIKALHPNINVHINKYASNYMDRLKKFHQTKSICEEMRKYLATPHGGKLTKPEAQFIQEFLMTKPTDLDYETIYDYVCYKCNSPAQTLEEFLKKPLTIFYNTIPKHLDRISDMIEEYLRVLNTCEFFECDYFDFKYEQDPSKTLYILDPPYLNTKNHTYETIPENKLMYIFSEIFTNKNILYFGNDRNPFFILLEYLKERGFLDIDIKKSKKKNSHVVNNEIIVSKKYTRV